MLHTRIRSAARLLVVAGVSVVSGAVPLGAQQPFEGALTMALNPGKEQQMATMIVKGKAVRMDMQSGAGGMGGMITLADGRTLMLMPAQKQYMVVVQDLQALAGEAKKAGAWKVTPLKASGTYAGTACDWYSLARGTDKGMEMCIASGLGDLGSRDRGGITDEDLRVLRTTFPKGFFPMAAREPGTGKMTFTVTKVERRSVTDAEVSVPSGWTEMKRPGGR